MGTRERRQREAGRRRREILEAARKVFWREGYDGATMPQIAREAELAAGTLYLYFPGKDSLYVALLEEGYDQLLARLGKATDGAKSPLEAAQGLIDAFFDFARDCPEYFGAMFFLLHRGQTPGGWERFGAELVARLRAGEAACKQIAADTLRRGGIEGPDAEATYEAVWSMLAGVVLYFRGTEGFDAIAARARAVVLQAVFGAEAASAPCPRPRTGKKRAAGADSAKRKKRLSPTPTQR
jgi:AcrR family transcriptional regulator